jgi:hypothetical protein
MQIYGRAGTPLALPAGWRTAYACAVDDAARILADDVVVQDAALTPPACVARCADMGYGAYSGSHMRLPGEGS